MGCGSSKEYHLIEKKVPRDWLHQFEALGLTHSDITKLFHVFKQIDSDQKGSLGITELLTFLEIQDTNFSRRTFSVFDANGSGRIDLREFVLSMWNYCTLTKSTLEIFAFDLYDEDTSGELANEEVEHMVEDLYGSQYMQHGPARAVVAELHKLEKHGNFDIKHFSQFVRSHQQMLFPAFQMQLKLQERVCGSAFWEKCTNRRVQWAKGQYITVSKLMEMHMDPERFKRFVSSNQLVARNRRTNALSGNNLTSEPTALFINTGTLHDRGMTRPQQQQHSPDDPIKSSTASSHSTPNNRNHTDSSVETTSTAAEEHFPRRHSHSSSGHHQHRPSIGHGNKVAVVNDDEVKLGE